MKRSEELLGLAIISIEDGKEIGRVSDLVVNPAKGAVEFLIIDNGSRYRGVKVLPFKMVEGVGEYAVTIECHSSITDLADQPEVAELLEKNVRVKGTKVLTKKGKLIGTVNEYLIDEGAEGKIAACEVTPVNGNAVESSIPAEQIITFGKDVLIVAEEAGPASPGNPTGPKGEVAVPETVATVTENKQEKGAGEQKTEHKITDPKNSAPRQEPSQAAKLFEEKQRQYLLGRKVSKRIETANGVLIAEEGDVITEEMMNKAKEAGKFTELSMNTKA